MSSLRELVRLEDPQFYLDDPFPVFARMRDEEPVFFYEELNTFVLTKHADIRAVSRNEQCFTSEQGIFLSDARIQDKDTESILNLFFPEGGEQIGTTDPPRHRDLRRAIAPAFAGRTLGRLEDAITGFAADLVAKVPANAPTDWTPFAGELPIRLIASLFGVPETDLPLIQGWSDDIESTTGFLSLEEFEAAARRFASMKDYVIERAQEKRRRPGDDLLTALVAAEDGNDKLSEANVQTLAMTVLAAASGTTTAALNGMIWAFAKHPGEWERVRADRSLVPGAVEESLRWVCPPRGFMRTCVEETEIRGTTIRPGQHVYLLYIAANRDEEVFPNAEAFDVARKENGLQLAFGFGTHVCIAAAMVRMEAAILLNTLLDRFSSVELVGEPEPIVALLRQGWHDMPVVFHD